MRDLCRELGGDREGYIDWLDLHLAGHVNDQQALAEMYKWLGFAKGFNARGHEKSAGLLSDSSVAAERLG